MLIDGYRLAYNARSAPADYFPSLIGVGITQTNPTDSDAYFERQCLPDVTVTSIALTRWVSYDSVPQPIRDPIVSVKTINGGCYALRSELFEQATEQGDEEVLSMLRMLKKGAVPA